MKNRKVETSTPRFDALVSPDVPFYLVGDLHGCDTLFMRLLDKLSALSHAEAKLVTVGDYVDRGENSATLLRRLFDMQTGASDDMVCLMGNHEEMLLNVLDDPVKEGPRWLRHGGLQTLASFRVAPPVRKEDDEGWIDMRDALQREMGEPLEIWLRTLPTFWRSGNVAVVHAGADPEMPVEMQTLRTLLWGHPSFETKLRTDGVWVAHGHTVTDTPKAADGRISTDSGAYATGRLTCALIEQGSVTFLEA